MPDARISSQERSIANAVALADFLHEDGDATWAAFVKGVTTGASAYGILRETGCSQWGISRALEDVYTEWRARHEADEQARPS